MSSNTNTSTQPQTEQLKSPRTLRRIPARIQLKPAASQSEGSSTETENPANGQQTLYVRPFDGDVSESDNNSNINNGESCSYSSDNESIMSFSTDAGSPRESKHPHVQGATYEECGGAPLEDYGYRDEDRPVNRFGFASKRSFCRNSCCSRKSSMSSMSSVCSSAYSADRSDMDVDEPMEM
ncbi:hypothetical protein PQX77_013598 [Marasmius sp. AFHP31]|nr:hypothetical protein PQX77_013598 [Marasmius sp. AFHP31]